MLYEMFAHFVVIAELLLLHSLSEAKGDHFIGPGMRLPQRTAVLLKTEYREWKLS